MVWTFAKNFSLQAFGFVQGVILARLLDPSDYGLIAMTGIFFAISGCFIDSGFSNALVRKKNRTELDYSTVFVTNVSLTLFFAIVLSLSAPFIADFYKEPLLTTIVRVNALLLVLNSVNAVQSVRMSIHLQFKEKSICSVIVNVSVGVATIIMAFMGFGVWSLIWPNFLSPILYFFLFRYYQHWFPGIRFSWKVWREFFSYGSKLLASGLLDTIFNNIYPLIIGKKFSATDLGYYSKGKGYANLPSHTVQGMLGQVTFPVLSKLQDDNERLEGAYRRLIRTSVFVVFPIMLGLAALARPFVLLLITEKWAPCIPYLQILCISSMWYGVHALNLNLLMVKGRSDLFLRLEIIKKLLILSVVFITARLSVMAMCIGSVFTSLFCLVINTYYTGKLINCGFFVQMRDIAPSLLSSLFMGFVVWALTLIIPSLWLQMIIGVPLGITLYVGTAKLMKSEELDYVKLIVQENVIKRFRK